MGFWLNQALGLLGSLIGLLGGMVVQRIKRAVSR